MDKASGGFVRFRLGGVRAVCELLQIVEHALEPVYYAA